MLWSDDEDRFYSVFSLDSNYEKNNKIKPRLYYSYSETYEKMNFPDFTDVFDMEKNGIHTAYTILNYDKMGASFDDAMAIRQFRSVVMEYPEKRLLSMSLPKSIPSHLFFDKLGNDFYELYANEKIEGNLLHLFYDRRLNRWEIATKRAVGGVYSFFHYKKKEVGTRRVKVRDMFLDALRVPRKTRFSDLTILNGLSKDHCYSFILQHPENPIIMPIYRPALYLIAVFLILPISKKAVSVSPPVYEEWSELRDIPVIQFPARYCCNSEKEYTEWYKSRSVNYSSAGIVLRNLKTGDHCVITNPVYEKMLKWRENSNIHSLQYQYLALRRIGKLNDFLAFFPKHKTDFAEFYEEYKTFVHEIHTLYMSKYVNKEKTQISDKYLYFIDDLHKSVYLPGFRNKNRPKVTVASVFEYFNKMEPEQLLYILNYDHRKFLQ